MSKFSCSSLVRPGAVKLGLLALGLCLLGGEAMSAPRRTSLTVTIDKVAQDGATLEGSARIRGERRPIDVTVEIPRRNHLLYYRWDGSVAEMKRGDNVEITGQPVAGEPARMTPQSIGLFKGKYTRGADFVRHYDNGSIQVRGRVMLDDKGWQVQAEDSVFYLDLSGEPQVYIYGDLDRRDLKKGQRAALTGDVEGGSVTRVSQLYVLEKKPGYVTNTAMARGGKRLFNGRVYLTPKENALFVGSGDLDGEVVPLTVRWTQAEADALKPLANAPRTGGSGAPQVVVLSEAGIEALQGERAFIAVRPQAGQAVSALWLLPEGDAWQSLPQRLADYPEVMAGKVVVSGEQTGLQLHGEQNVWPLGQGVKILSAKVRDLNAVKVGDSFVAIGKIPDDGRWLLDDPEVVFLFENAP